MSVVAIIQARTSSTRLPGKVLADVGGRTMLARVVRRTSRAALVDAVVVATSDAPADDPIVDECRRLAVPCFRGDEEDVLDRFFRAAAAHAADVVVRITADCPLIDPELIDHVAGRFLEERPDYASNVLRRTWPRGLDTEVVSAGALARAWLEASEPYERVHVTPYIYHHRERFRLLSVTGREDSSDARWTVDSPADLDLVREVYRRLGNDDRFGWQDVRRLLAAEPDLAEINRHVKQKQLMEG